VFGASVDSEDARGGSVASGADEALGAAIGWATSVAPSLVWCRTNVTTVSPMRTMKALKAPNIKNGITACRLGSHEGAATKRLEP